AQEVYAAVRHTIARGVAEAPWLADGPGSAVAARASLDVLTLPPTSRLYAREPQMGHAERRGRAEGAMRMFAPPAEPLFRVPAAVADAANADATAATEEQGFFSSLVYLGQLHKTYLVCQAPGELVLIDQHAAHERVAFKRLRDAHGQK